MTGLRQQCMLLGSSLDHAGFDPSWSIRQVQSSDARQEISPAQHQPRLWRVAQVLLKGADQLQRRLEAQLERGNTWPRNAACAITARTRLYARRCTAISFFTLSGRLQRNTSICITVLIERKSSSTCQRA